jgi:hypothetical protein
MTYHPLLAVLLLVTTAFQLPAQQDSVKKIKPPTPLFASDDPISIQLTADFKAIFKDRDTTEQKWHPAAFTWKAGADSGSAAVELTTRGHFRLKSSTCSFPMLRVRFPKDSTKPNPLKGTLFEKQSSIKLSTHCKSGNSRLEQVTHQEFLVYRTFNALTDSSFRVRFATATYVDPAEKAPVTAPSFFVEDDGDVADRMGMKKFGNIGAKFDDVELAPGSLMAVFFYFVGNTDWSLPYLHNVELFTWNGRYVSVPFDFDWSGVVSAPYARPDARLGTATVRERVWRGPCWPREVIDAAIKRIVGAKETIYGRYRAHPGLDPKLLKESLEYYDDFYKLVSDPRDVDRNLRLNCAS